MARKIRLAAAGIEITPKPKPLVTKAKLRLRERQLAFLRTKLNHKPPKGTSLVVEARRRCEREIREMKKQLSKQQGKAKGTFNRVTNRQPRPLAAASGLSQGPPSGGGGTQATSSDQRPPDSLTAKFNAAADPKPNRPISIHDIARLEKLRSKPGIVQAPSPVGRIGACYDPRRDRDIGREIKKIKSLLAERKSVAQKAFGSAAKNESLTHTFNRAAVRRR
ncbi:MAG: hypothetical protein Aurels2KO_53910 [Aureliella sp.]